MSPPLLLFSPLSTPPLPKLTALQAAAWPCKFLSSVLDLASNSLTRPSAQPAASAAPSDRSLPLKARSGNLPTTRRGWRLEPEWTTTRVEAVTAKSKGAEGQKSMVVTAPICEVAVGFGAGEKESEREREGRGALASFCSRSRRRRS